jgi:hypothetical protein
MTLESLRAFALTLPWFDYVGYCGMLLGLVSRAMRTIIPQRLVAIRACVCLGTFALLRAAWPTLVVNACTIPVLAWRTREMVMLTRRTAAAAQSSTISVDWLLPFMHPRPIRAGETLFKKGDDAGEMFYVCSGRLKLVEYDVTLGPGEVVGEIAMFSPTRTRTRTIVAETDCDLMAIGESQIKQLYYQNPRFGFYLIQLITRRLVTNMDRLEAAVAEQRSVAASSQSVVPAKAGTAATQERR